MATQSKLEAKFNEFLLGMVVPTSYCELATFAALAADATTEPGDEDDFEAIVAKFNDQINRLELIGESQTVDADCDYPPDVLLARLGTLKELRHLYESEWNR